MYARTASVDKRVGSKPPISAPAFGAGERASAWIAG